MSSFNWLHLTDLHFGLNLQEQLWPNVRASFFEDLDRLHDEAGPWNAVFFTGDLVQSGKAKEYEKLETEVFGPLWTHLEKLGSGSATLLPVPGNHDLARPNTEKPKAALRILLKEGEFHDIADEFWSDSECEYRELISEAFQNYSNWFCGQSRTRTHKFRQGVLPGDFAATFTLDDGAEGEIRIGVAGINSTFLQLAKGDYEGRLAVNVRQIHEACHGDITSWAKSHDACILLKHQGNKWLDKRSSEQAYPELNPAGRFAVTLFGHMHEHNLESRSFGGGETRREWQSSSLFGMEKFGDPPEIDRRHGYAAGKISFEDERGLIQYWPRLAKFDDNGWRFVPDHDSAVLLTGKEHTKPSEFQRHKVVKQRGTMPDQLSLLPVVNNGAEINSSLSKISAYRDAVQKAHTQIRFVEVPLQKDVPAVALQTLYVEPRLATVETRADLPPWEWPESFDAETAFVGDGTGDRENLVLLGDPGSGKSTLISCLAGQLCCDASTEKPSWRDTYPGTLPIPMILRELTLKTDLSWERLLEAFLEHSIGKLLPSREFVEERLSSGNAIVLLDGLDEVGNLSVRKKLKDAVHDGMAIYSKCQWILTSRIVGYASVPFHFQEEEVPKSKVVRAEVVSKSADTKTTRTNVAKVLFLAPFNDDQIKEFAEKWYRQHEPDEQTVDENAKEFVDAIRMNEGTMGPCDSRGSPTFSH